MQRDSGFCVIVGGVSTAVAANPHVKLVYTIFIYFLAYFCGSVNTSYLDLASENMRLFKIFLVMFAVQYDRGR